MSAHTWETIAPRLSECRACGYRVRELFDGSRVWLVASNVGAIVVAVFDRWEELPSCVPSVDVCAPRLCSTCGDVATLHCAYAGHAWMCSGARAATRPPGRRI